MHNKNRARETCINLSAWNALKDIAENHGIVKARIGDYDIGQLIASVVVNDDGTNSIFAGRCGWYFPETGRVITDVTAFIWHKDSIDPLQAVQRYPVLRLPAARAAYACDTDRQARALAAVASENGVLPAIEQMIDHER